MQLAGRTLVMITGLVAGSSCYKDALGPALDLAPATVLLTDSPFPFSLVDRVEVYVSQIAASMTADTLPETQRWVIIAEPRRRFELLALQQGVTEVAGVGQLPLGTYHAVRMTVNGDSSEVVLHDGRTARVRWPATGEVVLPAIVEAPLAVADSSTRIVLDFDVGRSFGYNLDPLFDFVFVPVLRAVRADSTGWLTGTVRGDPDGDGVPQAIADAIITVYRGSALATQASWWEVATGHTDAHGDYTVGFLPPGAYIVRLETPWSARLGAITMPDVLIGVGAGSRLDATLPGTPAASRAHRAVTSSVVRPHDRSRT